MPGPSRVHGHGEFADTTQRSVIMSRVSSSELSISIKMAQLDSQYSRLDSVHPAIPPNHAVVIFADLAVIPQDPNLILQLGVASHHRAGFTKRSKILSGIKAETRRVTKCPNPSTVIFRSVRLARIFNDVEAVFACKFDNRIHVRRLAEKINRNDCLRPSCQSALQRRWIHRIGTFV